MKTPLLQLLLILSMSAFGQSQIGEAILGENESDFFGSAISISNDGNRLAVGARLNDGNGEDAGHVRIFERTADGWVQIGADLDGEAPDDESGSAVALSGNGNRVAIGAIQNTANGPASGHVRVYEYDGADWVQLGSDINGPMNSLFGFSVDLSGYGGNLVVGATGASVNGSNSGQIRAYQFIDGNWYMMGSPINGQMEGDLFGTSVSISSNGQRIAAGARLNDSNGDAAGHVQVYDFTGDEWVPCGAHINGEAAGDHSGGAVSLSGDGNRLAIGSRLNQGAGAASGQTRIFEYVEGSWTQLGQSLHGESSGDIFGTAVALDHDGSRVAIGAKSNDGNGNNSGQARVYQYNWGTWMQVGEDIDGVSSQDQFGESVDLSYYGDELAVGAPFNDVNGTNSGHVRVFEVGTYTGLPDLPQEEPIRVSYNSSDGIYTITLDQVYESAQVRLFDITGSIVRQERIGTTARFEYVVDLPSGLYFLQIANNEDIKGTIKLLKE
ncbi:MAG: T9SS type A sorting domain-containing protein [Flavobacteriales bacterium]|nr:T9SS type A sorting domain-containing protein [Flavobacteriales bacterium]